MDDGRLLGYLLGALEPHERRAVERYLAGHPEARERLKALRRALEPLEADAEPPEPPSDLWERALARIEDGCPALPTAPPTSPRSPGSTRAWRRADALVAAAILICVGLLVPSGLSRLQFRAALTLCQNNLRALYAALSTYADQHNGALPDVTKDSGQPHPSLFAAALAENGCLPEQAAVGCPSGPTPRIESKDVREMGVDEFRRRVASLSGSYAYSLGHSRDGVVHGPRLVAGQPANGFLPLLADRPPDNVALGGLGNSASHGGLGQNVLYLDGHVRFATVRAVGVSGDDIFINLDHNVAPGKAAWDAVLAAGECR